MASFDSLLRPSEDDGKLPDLLIKEYIYAQTFAVLEQDREDFELRLHDYLRYMLDEAGMIFYKATWFCGLEPQGGLEGLGEEPHRLYTVHFFLFSHRNFTEVARGRETSWRNQVESPEFLKARLTSKINYDYSHFRSKIMAEQTTLERSRTFRPKQMPEGTNTGEYETVFRNPLQKFVNWWLVVPSVQYRFFDLLYQLYTFDIAHQGFWPKFLHMFTIHTNVICTMTFLAQWKFYESTGYDRIVINASFIYMAVLAIVYVFMGFYRRSVVWGFTTAFVLVLCWGISNLWFDYFAIPGNPIYNPTTWATNPLIWGYVSSFIESLSHLIVPQLPPYVTGVNHWESPAAFIREGRILYLFSGIFSTFIFAPAVSYISHPHLIGTAIIVIMFGLGYHEEFYSEYRRMVQKAELCGNPALDQVPLEFQDLVHGAPGNSGEGFVPSPPSSTSPVEKIMFWTGIQLGKRDAIPKFLFPSRRGD